MQFPVKRLAFVLLLLCSVGLTAGRCQPPAKTIDVDDAADEERLNREIWETMKGLPFSAVKVHLESLAHSQRDTRQPAAIAPLPTGWRLSPAGVQVPVGRLPYTAIPFNGKIIVVNAGYYTAGTPTKSKPEVSVVDAQSGRVTATLTFGALFPSVQVMGGDLFISGGIDQQVYRLDKNLTQIAAYRVPGYAGALAPLDDTHMAVSCLVSSSTDEDFNRGKYQKGRLAIIDTKSGVVTAGPDMGYFPYSLCSAGGKLYAGILGERKLQVFDARMGLLNTIQVGDSPQDITADGSTLYVVNANSDSVSVVDTGTGKVTDTISVRGDHTRHGSAPTSCAVDADRLYISLANINAIAVFDKRSHRRMGSIPTGWYPTHVLVDDKQLTYLSAKGIQPRRPNPHGPQPAPAPRNGPDYVLTLLNGSVGIVPHDEIQSHLRDWTSQVEKASPLLEPASRLDLPIKHIFYIVRENRTYDQVLGDLPKANGDPFLTLFGREITPNGHRLSEDYVTLDNYYADGEISVLGHSFTTSGYASPFLEWLGNASYSGRYRAYPFGTVPGVTSPAYLWDVLDAKHADYRIYGENYFLYTRGYDLLCKILGPEHTVSRRFFARMMELASVTDRGNIFYRFASPYYGKAQTAKDAETLLTDSAFSNSLSQFLCGDDSLATEIKANGRLKREFAEYLHRYPFNYRSWDLAYSDLDRFAAWKADFEDQLKRKKVAALHYLWLPNDHTAGAGPIPLPPDQLVAQNDAALGKIIETISHSPIWKESLILVTEDDAQNGPDHVDATRTVGLAIGPYVKRGAVVSDRYDQLSLLRTIEVLLGLAPLNRTDALAVPMYSIFTDQPDFTPYERPLLSSHLSPADKEKAMR